MKQAKRQTSLNEKDALTDLLEAEKLLLTYYSAAVTEASTKPLRSTLFKQYVSAAETQFTLFEQMLSRGYYKVQPAAKPMIDEKTECFKKTLKEVAEG